MVGKEDKGKNEGSAVVEARGRFETCVCESCLPGAGATHSELGQAGQRLLANGWA